MRIIFVLHNYNKEYIYIRVSINLSLNIVYPYAYLEKFYISFHVIYIIYNYKSVQKLCCQYYRELCLFLTLIINS